MNLAKSFRVVVGSRWIEIVVVLDRAGADHLDGRTSSSAGEAFDVSGNQWGKQKSHTQETPDRRLYDAPLIAL